MAPCRSLSPAKRRSEAAFYGLLLGVKMALPRACYMDELPACYMAAPPDKAHVPGRSAAASGLPPRVGAARKMSPPAPLLLLSCAHAKHLHVHHGLGTTGREGGGAQESPASKQGAWRHGQLNSPACRRMNASMATAALRGSGRPRRAAHSSTAPGTRSPSSTVMLSRLPSRSTSQRTRSPGRLSWSADSSSAAERTGRVSMPTGVTGGEGGNGGRPDRHRGEAQGRVRPIAGSRSEPSICRPADP
jgi:hypothetical protein